MNPLPFNLYEAPTTKPTLTIGQGGVATNPTIGTGQVSYNLPTFTPQQLGASVQGLSTTGQTPTPQTPIPQYVSPIDSSQTLTNQRRDALMKGINQRYQDNVTDLDNAQMFADQSRNKSMGFLNQQRDMGLNTIEKNRQLGKDQSRMAYNDLVTESRRRARAVGGAASSGFLDMTSRLDQQLQSNLNAVDTTSGSYAGQIELTAQQALGELEDKYNQMVAAIQSDRRKSLRERDSALAQAELDAAQEISNIQNWLNSQISTTNALNNVQENMGDNATIETQDAITNPNFGQTLQDVGNTIAPTLGTLQGYLNPVGLAGRAIAPSLPTYQQAANDPTIQQVKGVIKSSPFLEDLARRAGDVGNSFYGRNIYPGYQN